MKTVLLALVAALALSGAWLALFSDGGDTEAPALPARATTANAEPPAGAVRLVDALRGETDVAERSEVEAVALPPDDRLRIHGQVRFADGSAIAGARVELARTVRTPPRFEGVETRTDDEGRYAFRGELPERVVLRASREGLGASVMGPFPLDADGVLENHFVLGEGTRLAGRVTWPDGRPAGGAQVRVAAEFTREHLGPPASDRRIPGFRRLEEVARVAADASGAFSLAGLGAGPFHVRAAADGPDETRWRVRVDEVAPDTLTLELALGPPLPLAVLVRDERDAPVARVELRARPLALRLHPFEALDDVHAELADEHGRYELEGLFGGEWSVHVSAVGYSQRDVAQVRLPHAGPPLEILMQRDARLAGRVVDGSGLPVARASLELSHRDAGRGRNAESKGGGEFTFENLAPGPYVIRAEAAPRARLLSAPDAPVRTKYEGSAYAELTLAPGEQLADFELVLKVGGTVVGRVELTDGVPGAGYEVTLSRGLGKVDDTHTDDAGGFRFEHVPEGPYQLMAAPEELRPWQTQEFFARLLRAEIDVVEAREAAVVLSADAQREVEVSGRITSAGTPVANARMYAVRDGAALIDSVRMAVTDREGHYSVDLAGPGLYVFVIELPTADLGSRIRVAVPDVESFLFDVRLPTGGIFGRVVGEEGEPVPKAALTFTLGNDELDSHLPNARIWKRTTPDGHFDITNLRPGRYAVRAFQADRRDEYIDGAMGVTLESGVEVVDGERTRVELVLRAGGRLTGTVRGPDGSVVAGAGIYLRDGEGRPLARYPVAVSDALGRFATRAAPHGRVSVLARTESLATPEGRSLEVRAGEAATVELALVHATRVHASVVDEAGAPVSAALQVRDESGLDVGAFRAPGVDERSAREGFSASRKSFGPLPPGRYTVTATSSDGRTASAVVRTNGEGSRDVEVRF